MTVVQNVARDPAGNPVRATVTIRLITGDIDTVNTPGFTADGTVLGTDKLHTDDDGFWSIDLAPNVDYLPTGTFYEFGERPAGTRVTYVYYGEVPDVAGPVDLPGILVDPVDTPDALYLLATQKGAAGGLATLDQDGQVPADQLANASGGGGGGIPSSTVVSETTYSQSATAGAATAYSRGDHTHGTPALPTAGAIGAATSGHNHSGTYDPAGTAATAVAAHEADTTNVHGITDTSALATTSGVTAAISAHSAAADPHGDRAFATAAVGTHEADTTNVHGIADTANLVLTNDSRLSDARTPTAHAASHASAGGDPVTLAQSQITGLVAALAAKQDGDADLSTIAGLTATTDNVIQSVASAWASRTPAQLKATLSLVKGDVGLANVDNTSDLGKPISTLTQTALDGKQPLDADLTAIAGLTPTNDDVVQRKAGAWTNRTPAQLKTDLAVGVSDVSGLQAALDAKAALASPTFTGTPSLPTGTTGVTQSAGNSTTALATTAFVTTADNLKADLASPALTGNPTAPTQSQGNNSTRIATTAYVQTEAGLLVPKSLIDAKGDLIVGSAADTVGRLAPGTDGHVLTLDSAQSLGVKWAAAAGGSGTDYKSGASPKTGLWYRGNYGPVGANLSTVLNRLYAAPFRLNATTTFDRIGIDVATAAGAGGVARLGIYASDATGGLPGTLILDAGTVAIDSTGGKTITISQQLTAGMYWLAIINQTTGTAAVRATVSYDPMVPYFTGASMFTGSTAPGGISSTGTSYTGALSATPTIADNDNCPIIGLRSA